MLHSFVEATNMTMMMNDGFEEAGEEEEGEEEATGARRM